MRTVLLVDVHNWYTACLKKFPGRKVDYSEIAQLLPFQRKIAFGRQSEDKASAFAKTLRSLRYDVRFGGGNYNIEMALEVAQLIERRAVDHLVLGSSYFETIKIHEYAFERGIQTTAMGFMIPEAFGQFSDVIELDTDILEIPDEVSIESAQQLIGA